MFYGWQVGKVAVKSTFELEFVLLSPRKKIQLLTHEFVLSQASVQAS